MAVDALTEPSPFRLLGGDRKNSKYFDYDFHNCLCHCRSRWHFRIQLEPSEKGFHALAKTGKCILVGIDFLGRLTSNGIRVIDTLNWLIENAAHQEKNANSDKYCFCRGEYLISDNQRTVCWALQLGTYQASTFASDG
jgi:hypothetical protein